MDFKQLESFIKIAQYNSFSRAAEKLYLTQPTLSNHIISLEKELKTFLFNRANKKVSLTDAGILFHQHALDILHSRDRALFALNEFKSSISGSLEISSSTIPQYFFLANLIQKFNLEYPNVKYKILRHDSEEVLKKITLGEIDFGIVGKKMKVNNIEYKEIMGDEIVLISNSTFSKDVINIQQIKSIPLILREKKSATRSILLDKLSEYNIKIDEMNIVAEIENASTIKQFVNRGIGLAFVSTREINSDLNCNKLKIIEINDFKITRNFYFAYNKKMSKFYSSFLYSNYYLQYKLLFLQR